ncbi:Uncharacterized protein dnm_018530 [Desulfonema magnum]|uniref:Uncharacterized protein n=1 Tax=Desulfonema magnum TaxID=45655 RepID=A0A975BI93_9BACT|nr:Uncharacterized protein dnm_018530 [Desulfonema magnum]
MKKSDFFRTMFLLKATIIGRAEGEKQIFVLDGSPCPPPLLRRWYKPLF